MGFKHHTGNEIDSPNREPDTALPVVIIIDTMIPAECLKCFSQPFFYTDFYLQLLPPWSTAISFPIWQSLKNN